MKRSIALIALLICAPLAAVRAQALPEDRAADRITVQTAYAFATSPVQKNGAVFARFENKSDKAMCIEEPFSTAARQLELHTMEMDGDIMQMRQVQTFTVPAHASLDLTPMGHHIMLLGLHAPLKTGERFSLRLKTRACNRHPDGETQQIVDVLIVPPGETP